MSPANSAVSKVGPRTFLETKEWMQLGRLEPLCIPKKSLWRAPQCRKNIKPPVIKVWFTSADAADLLSSRQKWRNSLSKTSVIPSFNDNFIVSLLWNIDPAGWLWSRARSFTASSSSCAVVFVHTLFIYTDVKVVNVNLRVFWTTLQLGHIDVLEWNRIKNEMLQKTDGLWTSLRVSVYPRSCRDVAPDQ